MMRIIRVLGIGFVIALIGYFCENSGSHICKGAREGKLAASADVINAALDLPFFIYDDLSIIEIRNDKKHIIFIYSVTQIMSDDQVDEFENNIRFGLNVLTCSQKDNHYNFIYDQGIETIHRFLDNSGSIFLEFHIRDGKCMNFTD